MSHTKAKPIGPHHDRTELCLQTSICESASFTIRAGRHSEPQSKPLSDVAVFRGYLVKRGTISYA